MKCDISVATATAGPSNDACEAHGAAATRGSQGSAGSDGYGAAGGRAGAFDAADSADAPGSPSGAGYGASSSFRGTSSQSGLHGAGFGAAGGADADNSDPQTVLERVLRRSHFVEAAATAFFEGHNRVTRSRPDAELFRDRQRQNLATIEEIVPEHRVRSLWKHGTHGRRC